MKLNRVFDDVHNYVRGSSMAAWVLAMAIVILLIGMNGFAEDTYSSYVGVKMLEEEFGLRPASWTATYWSMALVPQIVSMVAFFFYLSNRKDNWGWGVVAIVAQMVDFITDIWYRSNGDVFSTGEKFFGSMILTFVFFTVGSEVALSIGFGMTTKMFVEGMVQLSIFLRNLWTGLSKAAQMILSGDVDGKGHTDAQVSHKLQDIRFHQGNPQQGQGGGQRPLPTPEMIEKMLQAQAQQGKNGGGKSPNQGHRFQPNNNQQQKR